MPASRPTHVREQDTVFFGHVFEQFPLQALERLLERNQGVGHVVAVPAHDLVDHRIQPWQFDTKGLVVASLDVGDERGQTGVGPQRTGRRGRDRCPQGRQHFIDIETAGRARLGERNLAAAAEVDLMLLKNPDGGGLSGRDLGNGIVWCNGHRQVLR